jgi:predicted DNA-binding transcriptional regulator AlpA
MLTAAQVAAQLGLSTSTVYSLHRSGILAGYWVTPSALRFAPADITAYLAACRSIQTKRAVASFSSSIDTSPASESELDTCFRKVGLAPRPTRSKGVKARAYTPSPAASAPPATPSGKLSLVTSLSTPPASSTPKTSA